MANLDTRSKRASGAQILQPWVMALVFPDGAIGAGDRQHIPWLYSGIVSVSATPAGRIFTIWSEARAYPVETEVRAYPIRTESRVYPVEG